MQTEEVTQRVIPGYSKYVALSTGVILHRGKHREVKQFVRKNNKPSVHICNDNGVYVHISVECLVCTAFFNYDPIHMLINHKDHNVQNNALDNIEIVNLETPASVLNCPIDEFRDVYAFPGYRINIEGILIGKRGKPIYGKMLSGYKYCHGACDGKEFIYPIHRMVLETFYPVDNMENLFVNHKNGNKTDNRLCNLEWCTKSGNAYHALRTGLMHNKCGTNNVNAVLTRDAVIDIRQHCRPKTRLFSLKSFAKKYNCSINTIHNVLYGVTYKDITNEEADTNV